VEANKSYNPQRIGLVKLLQELCNRCVLFVYQIGQKKTRACPLVEVVMIVDLLGSRMFPTGDSESRL